MARHASHAGKLERARDKFNSEKKRIRHRDVIESERERLSAVYKDFLENKSPEVFR